MFRANGRQVLFFCAGSLFVVFLAGCGASPTPGDTPSASPLPLLSATPAPTPDTWSKYRNPKYNYVIEIAPDWTIDDSSTDEVIIFIGRSQGLAGLHVLALDWSGTLEEFARENFSFHQRRARVLFEPISRSRVQMASGPTAERFEYRVQNEARFCVEHLVDLLLLAGGQAYALQGTACESAVPLYLSLIEAMQRSFTLAAGRAMAQARSSSPAEPTLAPPWGSGSFGIIAEGKGEQRELVGVGAQP